MDAGRFDRWTKALVAGCSRRVALRAVTSGAAAAGLTRLGWEEAAAACKQPGKPCDKAKDCCHKLCKRGKCRCKQLRRRCDSSVTCCDSLSTACNHNEKPQCDQDGFRCLRLLNANCGDDCDCAVGMVCAGSPLGTCCFPTGAPCGFDDSVCCSFDCAAGVCQ
jgi:hypothetical protein